MHLPRLPLDALRPRWSDPAALPLPVVVLEQERVVSANRLAMREGVHAGLRRAGAQALVPHAIQLDRDMAAETRLLQSLALALLAFTPHVTLVVSVRPMGTRSMAIMSPVSRPASICMSVMPDSASPASIARWMGAAPRQRGSSDAWMLMQPKRGRSSTSCGRIRP